jgi:mannose-6-phosphate isomerase-like protein (cupin superfamily)
MTAPPEARPADPWSLSENPAGLLRTGEAVVLDPDPDGPPPRVDGYTVGVAKMSQAAPHLGELHPDADELLYLVSGAFDLVLDVDERGEGGRTVPVEAGQAVVVPRGVWHRVLPSEPSHIVYMTPGPGRDHHPLDPPS